MEGPETGWPGVGSSPKDQVSDEEAQKVIGGLNPSFPAQGPRQENPWFRVPEDFER